MTTPVIRSIFEDYLSPARSTAAKNSFDSDSQRKNISIWGVIKGHLVANKMLEKSIKDHPIFVEDYTQWRVSHSGIKESMDTKIMAAKLKDKVDKLSSSSVSSYKSINELKIYVAFAKKSANTIISKL